MGHKNLEDMRQGRDMFKKSLKTLESEGRFWIAGQKRGKLPYVKQH